MCNSVQGAADDGDRKSQRRSANIIIRGLLTFTQVTCIRFVTTSSIELPLPASFSGTAWAVRARTGYLPEENGCLYTDTVQHKGLTLGFHHEQVRSDRMTRLLLPKIFSQAMLENLNVTEGQNRYTFSSIDIAHGNGPNPDPDTPQR
ncbi:astacin like metallo-protease precursor [Lates japonicus]|uniref:Astacin like metallo-protease n=1 Tax=Lates japonicus TaxID=270547 RepID=A0AAD3NJM0_LATJO|nr:astacin like metallo-protease precursor [Lates japonicus]